MKRPSSSDSVGGLITEKSLGELNNNSSSVYSRGFQSMLDGLDDEDGMEESGHVSEKKRRLSVDQVKALEKNFEVENKLEPDRKMKLAQELGLQPRQVAVWFQNRRARWKTKQLERDYGVLKANYDTLKLDFESLKQEKEGLLAEVKELKSKLQEDDENTDTGEGGGGGGGEGHEEMYIKEEIQVTDEPIMFSSEQREIPAIQSNGAGVFGDFKDGSSDSDSSAILNDENTNNNSSPNASSGVLNQHMTHMSPASGSASSPLGFNCSSSSSPPSTNGFQFSTIAANAAQKGGAYHQNQHFGRMEEHNFFGTDETCNFFAEDQAPSLQWYYSTEQWN